MTDRDSFERWISAPPYERSVERFAEDASKVAWPGQYRIYEVQLAWEAVQEFERRHKEQSNAAPHTSTAELKSAPSQAGVGQGEQGGAAPAPSDTPEIPENER